MKFRYLVFTIDTISDLLKDYMGQEDMPEDAMPVKLMIDPTNKGKLAIEFVSDSFKQDAPPLNVDFTIRRIFGVA